MQKKPTIVSKLGAYRKSLENLLNVKAIMFNKVNAKNQWVYNEYYTTKGVKSDVVEVFKFYSNSNFSIGFQYLNVNDEDRALITVSLKKDTKFLISKTFDYKTFKTYIKLFIAELSLYKSKQSKYKSVQEIFQKTLGSFELGSKNLVENCKKDLETELLKKDEIVSKVSDYLKTSKLFKTKKENLETRTIELRKELGIDDLEALLAKKTKELEKQLSKQKEEVKTLEHQKFHSETVARNLLSKELNKISVCLSKYPYEVINHKDIKSIQDKQESLVFGLQKQISSTY